MTSNNLITFKTTATFTDLDRRLLGLARDGYRQKEMCLFVGRRLSTVKRDWLILLSKIGARTPAQAVALAIQKGIIGPYNGDTGTRLVRGAR